MAATTEVSIEPRTYGNLTTPRKTGVLGLSMGQSMLGVPVIGVLVLLLSTGHIIPGLIVLLVGAVLMAMFRIGVRQGRSIYGRIMLRVAQRRKVASKRHVYIAGPTGFIPTGETRLPGLMAKSRLSEHADSFGTPFGMIRVSGNGTHHYSVVLEAHPEGRAVYDDDQMDAKVAHWAAWLTQRGLDEGLRGASVTIETAPDSGLRLPKLFAANEDPAAPDFAKQVGAQIQERNSFGAPQLMAYVTLTFDGRRVDGKSGDRGAEDMAEDIGAKLPMIVADLGMSGAGSVSPCSAQDIVDLARTAYDPTTAAAVEEAQANGGTGLRWEDAGPSFAADLYDRYHHDRSWSKSWTMYEGPRGSFTSDSLKRATEPAKGALRKRTTILYRPIPADQATNVVEQEQKDAIFSGSQQRISARAQQRLANARKSAQEESRGAGLTRFGIIVTVTTDEEDKLKEFDRTVPGTLSHAKLRVRPALANQAVTFQAGLPLGLVLSDHMMLPEELRAWF